jgi:hypothetical protein
MSNIYVFFIQCSKENQNGYKVKENKIVEDEWYQGTIGLIKVHTE